MARFRYEGEDIRYLPSLGVEISNGSIFEAPDDFTAHQCVLVSEVTEMPNELGAENVSSTIQ